MNTSEIIGMPPAITFASTDRCDADSAVPIG
jgi:hypothetical protein